MDVVQLPHNEPLEIELTAGAGPSGGTFSWSASGAAVQWNGPVATVTITQPGSVSVTVTYTVNGNMCSDTCNFEVVRVELQIDSDNNNGYGLPDGSAAEKEVADVAGHPGKLILVNNGDHDGDGIPGYADGFNLIPELESDEQSEGTRFVPMRLRTGGNVDFEEHGIQFVYDASPPGEVIAAESPDGYQYTPAPGSLRIWMKDGDQLRDMRDVVDGGDFISTGQQYAPEDLGLPAEGGEVILWVEAIRPSVTMGDHRISVHVGVLSDAVRLTAHGMQTVNVGSNGVIGGPGIPNLSHPTPVITTTEFELINVRASSDNISVLADVVVSGTIADKFSDLRPGPAGVIDTLYVMLNDEPMALHGGSDPVSISVVYTKGHDPESLLRPYEYSGAFSAVIEGVEIQPGWNTVRLIAENSRGLRGFSERAFELTFDPPPDQEIDITVEFLKGSKSEAFLVDLFVASHQGPPQHFQGKCTQVSPGVYEIPGVLGGFIYISDTEDPASADLFPLSITLPDYSLSSATIWVERVDPAEPIFEGDGLIEEHHRPDWTGYVFDIEPVTNVDASLGGVFEAFLMEWIGPQDMLEFLQEIEFHSQFDNALGEPVALQRVYEVVEWDGRALLSLQKSERPEIMLALPSATVDVVSDEGLAEWLFGVWLFTNGFKQGFVDTGIDLVDTVGAVAKLGGHIVWNYNPVARKYRFYIGESVILEEDLDRISVTLDVIQTVATIVKEFLAQQQQDLFYAIVSGDVHVLNVRDKFHRMAMEFGVELLEAAWDALAGMNEYQKGRILGRITGEIVLEIGLAVGTGGAATAVNAVRKSHVLARVITKLANLPDSIIPASVKARLPGLQQYYQVIDNAEEGARAAAILRRIEQTEDLTGIDRFKRFLDYTSAPNRRRAVEMSMRPVMNKVMREVYTDATSLTDIPTVQQLRSLKNSAQYRPRLVNQDLEIHHTVPEYLLRRLVQIENPDWSWGQVLNHVESIADTMPGMILHRADHVGIDAQGLASLHNVLQKGKGLYTPRPHSIGQLPFTKQQILEGLRDGYDDWGRSEVWPWMKQWLQQSGIDTVGY
ncbi:MAG: hypothetical protein EA376_03645 [Phycisphaeraceae bacterium]|nr:MAG: hypothetical protein EA376_03645 [Phycisphaeraceae bacterium]